MAGKLEGSKAHGEAKDPSAQTEPGAEKKRDIFIRDAMYPDPEAAFRIRGASIMGVRDTGLFVLDTNALLAPYGVGNRTLGEVRRVFTRLVEQKRLRIPAQVAREFADNRAKRLTEIYGEVQQKRQRPVLARSPLLDSMSSYAAVAKAEEAVDAAWGVYAAALDEMLKQMKAWSWDDPVSSLYTELFVGKGIVTSIKFEPNAMRDDLRRRSDHDIPPGYKDRNKDDGGIGDLLIWKTILDVGKAEEKDVIFVSGDAKTDWWHRAAGGALYPRFELLAEFDAASGGRSFNIVTLADFLELFGVDEKAVEEVRTEERRPKVPLGDSTYRFGYLAEQAVLGWIYTWNGVSNVKANRRFPDFDVVGVDGSVTGVEVKATRGNQRQVVEMVTRQAQRWLEEDPRRERLVIVLVLADEQAASEVMARSLPPLPGGLQLVVGWLDGEQLVRVSLLAPQD